MDAVTDQAMTGEAGNPKRARALRVLAGVVVIAVGLALGLGLLEAYLRGKARS